MRLYLALLCTIALNYRAMITTGAQERNHYFNLDLIQGVIEQQEGNFIMSPANVKTALITMVEGTGGRTRQQLLDVLRLPQDFPSIRAIAQRSSAPLNAQRSGTETISATRLWTNKGILVSNNYAESLKRYYGTDLRSLDFSDSTTSANVINDWVRISTKNNINNLVGPGSINPETKIMLTSTLYFNGKWLKAFDPKATRTRCFHTPQRGCQDTLFMENQAKYRNGYIPSLLSDVVEIPYADNQLAMIIYVPRRTNDENLLTLSRDLPFSPLSIIRNALQEEEVILAVPKFSFESKIDLRPTLDRLGIHDLFDLNANLTNFSPNSGIRVGGVLHNAKIEVSEEGTIAAAATAISVVPLMGSTTKIMRIDKPFLFQIVDLTSSNILFAGRITKPAA